MLLTKDTITIQARVLEYKLYAPGVGPVLVLGVSGGGGREELVKVERVNVEAARAAAGPARRAVLLGGFGGMALGSAAISPTS